MLSVMEYSVNSFIFLLLPLERMASVKRFVSLQFPGGLTRREAATCTGQHEYRINANKHACLEWDSNPRPQCLSGR
jgi:hypothetical protein